MSSRVNKELTEEEIQDYKYVYVLGFEYENR